MTAHTVLIASTSIAFVSAVAVLFLAVIPRAARNLLSVGTADAVQPKASKETCSCCCRR
jgi:hypothetical protein